MILPSDIENSTNLPKVWKFLRSGATNPKSRISAERIFSKHFPILYEDLMKQTYPPDYSFRQKLYHYFTGDPCGCCETCGNPTKFLVNEYRYAKFCSSVCSGASKTRRTTTETTMLQRYGKIGYNNRVKYRETLQSRYSDDRYVNIEKNKETKLRNHGDEKYNNRPKAKQSCVVKYGTENYTQSELSKERYRDKEYVQGVQMKSYETKKKNKSFNTSSIETSVAQYLIRCGIEYISQYRDSRYPFNCDFYFPEQDLFVEIQGSWTHGGHPFNPETDLTMVQLWLEKNSKFYDNAVDTWVIRDVKKRETARNNNLNYLEIFSIDFRTCIETILNKITQSVDKY